MCVNIYMLNWKILEAFLNVNPRNAIRKAFKAENGSKPQLSLKVKEIFPLTLVKQIFSLPVLEVVLFQ